MRKKKTFDSITSCVQNKEQEIEVTYRELARCNMQTIAVEHNKKKFHFTFDKRVVRDDFSTVPYCTPLEFYKEQEKKFDYFSSHDTCVLFFCALFKCILQTKRSHSSSDSGTNDS